MSPRKSAASRAVRSALVLGPLLIAAVAVALAVGAGEVSLSDGLRGVEPAATVLFRLRLPRVVLAAEVGAALGLAGVALQALLRNPLADPFVFGLSGGAAVGATLANLAAGGAAGVLTSAATWTGLLPAQMAAMAGALTAALFVYALGRTRGALSPERALLVGVVFNSFASAIVLTVQSMLRPEEAQSALLWLSGALGYERAHVLAVAAVGVLVPATALIALAGRLNLLALGDDAAAALGVDVRRTRLWTFVAASIAVGAAVALSGLVGFVGLVVPHAVRLVAGPDHRVLLPASALGGAAFLVLADAAARVLFRGLGVEPPVGAVTALIGAPLFVALLWSRR